MNVNSGACRVGRLRYASVAAPQRAFVTAFVFLALLFAAAPRVARAQETIKIGVLAPLSGNYKSAGADIVDGAKLAAEQINAAGGILGKKLEIVSQDDACNPDQAANAASRLIAEGIAFFAGGYCSSAALPELRVSHDAHVPYVLDASTIPQLTEHGWQDVFRTIGRTDVQGTLAASLMKGVLHAKRAAVINDGSSYSQVLAQSTAAALEQQGLAVTYDDAISPGQQDYSAVLKTVADARPDVLYFTGYYAEAAIVAKNLQALDSPIKHFMGNGSADPSLIEKGGTAVEGMIVTTSPLPQFLEGARARRFVKAYRDAYQREPGPYSVYEYDAVGVVAQAMKNAKSTKPEAISAALHALKRYDGATGEISFDAKGDRVNAAFMAVTVREGKFVPFARVDGKGQWGR